MHTNKELPLIGFDRLHNPECVVREDSLLTVRCPDCDGVFNVQATLTYPRPILVSERLPEQFSTVLAYSSLCSLGWTLGVFHGNGWYDPSCGRADPSIHPTHWLPLPPKAGVNEKCRVT